MENYLKDTVKGFGERTKRLAIFNPLFELKRQRKMAGLPLELDWFGLGLLTLLFFFESKLHRQNKKGRLELADYLFELTSFQTGGSRDQYEKISQILIENFRNPSGRRHSEIFYNWETNEMEEYQFSILKTDTFDSEANRQYFTLDEAGLDLIFATKEYFHEFRISISQLLIRKQLEKGEFASALHEIHEMRISVQTLRDQLKRLGLEITRNIISEEVHEKYNHTVKAMYDRLEREEEEFQELYHFVRETQEKIEFGSLQDPDEQARIQIAQVERELRAVHGLHRNLLYEALVLKTKALEAARQALFSVGVKSFNFDQEIVSRIVSSPLPLEAVTGLTQPFLRLPQQQNWSLLSLFSAQRLQKNEEEEMSIHFPEWDEEIRQEQFVMMEETFIKIMKDILEVMPKCQFELKDLLPKLPAKWMEQSFFCQFWLLLHQRSPLQWVKGKERHVLDKALSLVGTDVVEVVERPELLTIGTRYVLQNMQFTRRSSQDEV